MKLKFLIQLILVAGCTPVNAQWYNDTVVINTGGLVSDWSVQTWNTANGNYSTTGSTGVPGNYGVFEHYGQSGSNNNSAFRNDGIFNASVNGRDYFKGPGNNPGQQGIGGSVAPVFGELFLENGTGQPFDISNTNGADIAGSASFANGVTTTVRSAASTGALRFRDNAVYVNTAAGDAQYVNGYVTKSGDDAFTFPVGAQDGNDLRILQINAPASVNNTLSVAYWNGSADSGLDPTPSGTQNLSSLNPSGITGIDKLASISPICFWDWVASGTSPLTITVSIPSFAGNGGYASAAEMRLAGWNLNTLQWDNLSGSTGATGNLEGSTITGNVTDMSNYGAIAIGNVLSSPLAVDILSFSGYMDRECSAHLNWTTAAENDIKAFYIQYSFNGRDYREIARMDVSNFTIPNNYNYSMQDVPAGEAIFRMKALYKHDNPVYYPKELHLNSNCKMQDYLKITPNPTQNNVTISGFKGKSDVSLFDMMGRRLYSIQTEESELQLNLENYPSGIYILKVRDDNFVTKYEKIIKQ